VVLFPNRIPESFSYALSETWDAGLPVIGGPEGALGERIARHGGGWLLPAGFDAADIAACLARVLGPDAAEELARVRLRLSQPDEQRVPTLHAMAESLEAYYRRYGREPVPGEAMAPASIDALLAPSLDYSLFRQELAHLATMCDQSGGESKRAREFETEARSWIAKLETDVADLQAQLRQERERLAGELSSVKVIRAAAALTPDFLKRALRKVVRRARR